MRPLAWIGLSLVLVSPFAAAVGCSGDEAISPVGGSSTSSSTSGATSSSSSTSSSTSSSSASSSAGGGHGGAGGGAPTTSCDPLVPTTCGYPFPSSFYLVDDASTATGKRVAFGPTSLPARKGKAPTDPAPWNTHDGFSPGASLLTDLPGATADGLPSQDTIWTSVTTESATIVLDTATGELVPHFSEIDVSAASKDGDHALIIRPVVRLKDATRYVVAIRRVLDAKHAGIAPSPAFLALRDGTKSSEPSIEARRPLYADIFAKLATAGIPKADLQLAWDFVTASKADNTKWMVHMRDEALATVGPKGPTYAIDMVEDNPNPEILRRIHGHMTVPLYLDQPGPGGRLVFGADGLPKQNGTADYPFLVHVPNAASSGTPLPLVQNGHGLLGSKSEGQDGYLADLADKNGYIAFGVDFVGFADEDSDTVQAAIMTDIGAFEQLVERQHQGMLNSLLAMRMMKGGFLDDPLVQFNGKSAIDPTQCFYRGDSQGGIFGVTYMALSTDVTRGLLGEPGMPYDLLLNRSVDFEPFFLPLRLEYKSGRDIQLVVGIVEMLWDRIEPDGYAPYITGDMLPNTPKHEVLIHAAIGDYQVTPLGAHIIARAVQAKNLTPVNRTVYGIPDTAGPFMGSGMVEFSFGLPDAPKTNVPTTGLDSLDPHDKVRVLDAARNMSDVFFRTGVIQQTCAGACDPQ